MSALIANRLTYLFARISCPFLRIIMGQQVDLVQAMQASSLLTEFIGTFAGMLKHQKWHTLETTFYQLLLTLTCQYWYNPKNG